MTKHNDCTRIFLWAKALGEPETWKGNCFGIASQAVKAKLVEGKAVYGHWLGRIHPESYFSPKAPVTPHGWIRNDWLLVDPTRWVFENVPPYIWFGPLDSSEYDEGGNIWRKMMEKPLLPYDSADVDVDIEFPPEVLFLLNDPPTITVTHACWLANLSLQTLGDLAWHVYDALDQATLRAFIPWDNWHRVMEG